MRCFNCPAQVIPLEAELAGWIHAEEAITCRKSFTKDTATVATPDLMSMYLGRAVIVSTKGQATYGVLRSLTPSTLILITRDGSPVTLARPSVKMVSELTNPLKQGLSHDA